LDLLDLVRVQIEYEDDDEDERYSALWPANRHELIGHEPAACGA